ncbi:MAG: T9SS type A sorting domain-containing protein [Flavobacteriia bacterium]|jgi:hypothetical protein
MIRKYSLIPVTFLICILFSDGLRSQFNFEYSDSIPVYKGGNTLDHAWAGGFNYAQFSDIDYDFDGDLDLVIFDRSSDNIKVFLQEDVNGNPQYRFLYNGGLAFPSDVRYRMTTVDYDSDGRKDLFAYGIGGIKVFKNVGDALNGLQWEVAKNLLYSDYSGIETNLYVSSSDIPAIVDVEGDGDIDVLTFHISGEHLQYHQNQSMDLYGIPDSLVFVLKNDCWGKFREDLNTSTVYLNDTSLPCSSGNVPGAELPPIDDLPSDKKPSSAESKHSGSTILALDIDNSGVLDLVLGDVSYPNLNLLINGGTSPNTNSAMVSVDGNFPSNSLPASVQIFPASFLVDTDFDGKRDFIVCPNAKNTSENESSIRRYKNLGTDSSPIFVHQTNDFLQNEMIEHGTGTIPVFFDFDQDGLEDLFVANYFRYIPTLNKEASIAYYRNTGTATNPEFTYIDYNFLNLNISGYGLRMIPAFGDIDGDGDTDMFIGRENGSLVYYQNTSSPPSVSFASPVTNYADHNGTPISSGQYATPQLFDLNEDGLLDLLVGRKTGEIMYYKNIGTNSNPSFQLENDTLGNIDIATLSPDGFATPHFFKFNDTIYLFLGGADGKLRYYDDIENNLSSGSSFHLYSDNFLNVKVGAYSSFFVNDIDQDGYLNLFIGQDLGGVHHLEVNPNSQADLSEIDGNLGFVIYPNPTDGVLSVSSEVEQNLIITVTDLFGKPVLEELMFSKKTTIDLQDRSSGIYLVIVSDDQGNRSVKKIVKN